MCAAPDRDTESERERAREREDPVQSAKDAIAQLVAMAGTLATHQVERLAHSSAETACTSTAPVEAPACGSTSGVSASAHAAAVDPCALSDGAHAGVGFSDTAEIASSACPTEQTSTGNHVVLRNQAAAFALPPVRTSTACAASPACSVDHGTVRTTSSVNGEKVPKEDHVEDRTCASHEEVEEQQTKSPKKLPKKWEELQRLDWLLRVQSPPKDAAERQDKPTVSTDALLFTS